MSGNDDRSRDFRWVWNDPSHRAAHSGDFITDPDRVLELLAPRIALRMPDEASMAAPYRDRPELAFHDDFELEEPVGLSGLRNVCDESIPSFWGYRPGRRIPSHLCLGEKAPTQWICLWGWWEPGRFVIHTLYPGRVAPREIHDPDLSTEDIPAAIEFWRCHAIVVGEGEYSLGRDGKS